MATTDRDDEIPNFADTEDGLQCKNCGSLDVTRYRIVSAVDFLDDQVWTECEVCDASTVK